MGLLGGVFWFSQPARAQSPAGDLPCRGCHGENDRLYVLPSGEALPLHVPLDALDASVHSYTAESPVYCSSCHTKRERYLYPHAPNLAETRHEFVAEISATCAACHYPHLPFHDAESTDPALPACGDCHGSHAIGPIETLTTTMPVACIQCHTDQPLAWAEEMVAPRPGRGERAAGYAGSSRCGGCHEDLYTSWQETLHARLIQDPRDGDVLLGDFAQQNPDLTFTPDDIAYTVGSRWKQQYLTESEDGTLQLLPAQWNVETSEWASYHPDGAASSDWLSSCGSCHVTGLNMESGGFAEFSVGCESCHGPAEAHASDPLNVKPFAQVDDQVCGACHSRGASPEGLPYPATYRPGDPLDNHFTFTSSPDDVWPDGSARRNHQQFMDWHLGSPKADQIDCITCHTVHDSGTAAGQLRAPLNDLCLGCHNEQRALVRHVPFHEKAITKRDFTCADCHMPSMATSAVDFDIRVHSFLQPEPAGSVAHGGVEAMPNACNRCHTALGETPEWAAQTIAHAVAQATPDPASFFGPGPTPTSPPPPTPVSSVGQPAVLETAPAAGWLRTAFFGLLGVLALGVVAAVVYAVFVRRAKHV